MLIGEQIKKIRNELNLTQQQFANKLKTSRNNIAGYETGRNPSEAVVTLICREFNVNENWLRTGEGEMFTPNIEDNLKTYLSSKGVSKKIQAFIITYLSLTDDMKKAVDNYIEKVYEEMQNEAIKIDLTRPEGLSDKEWETIVKMRTEEAMKRTEK